MTRALPIVLTLVAGVAGAAQAGEPTIYQDDKAGFQVTVPDGWVQVNLAQNAAGALATFANDATGQLLVITRVDGPTDDAAKDDAAFYATLEAGVKKAARGYKKLSSSARKLTVGKTKKRVRAFDLWFRVDRDKTTVTMGARWLFMSGYALSLMIDSPSKKSDAAAQKIVSSFAPLPPT